MRVGPITPMTPFSPPASYDEVTRVKSLSLVSGISAGIAEPLRQRGADFLQGEAGEPLVENLSHLLHRVGRQETGNLDKDGAHHAALQIKDQEQPFGRYLHQLQPFQYDL